MGKMGRGGGVSRLRTSVFVRAQFSCGGSLNLKTTAQLTVQRILKYIVKMEWMWSRANSGQLFSLPDTLTNNVCVYEQVCVCMYVCMRVRMSEQERWPLLMYSLLLVKMLLMCTCWRCTQPRAGNKQFHIFLHSLVAFIVTLNCLRW